MPYSITDKNPDCSGWAVVDPDNKVFGCHTTKESAIKQAVAISLATDEPFVGERKADGTKIIISDIDGTLLNAGRRIEKTWSYIQAKEGLLFLVTGRPESERASTEQQLADADIRYSRLIMNPGSTADSADYKKATAEKLLETYNIVLAVENNPETVRAYRSLGIETIEPSQIRSLEARAINQDAPAYMRAAAKRGLEYYAEGLGGDGLVERTIREARLMAEGTVSDDKWIRIAAWIARHLGDLDSPDADPQSENYPSPGVVAHLLWGSGPSKASAQRALNYAESVVARIRAEQESERMTEQRAYLGELNVDDYVAWIIQTDEIEDYAGVIVELTETDAKVSVWDEEHGYYYDTKLVALVPIKDLKKIEPLPTEPVEPTLIVPLSEPAPTDIMTSNRDKWIRTAWAIKAKLEGLPNEARSIGKTEQRTNHMELRAVGDGMTFEGYAAVFNSPSEPLPFTEIIRPGAFSRSLRSRNRMMLLWNHDSSQPLASTRNGSLQMREDDYGLKVVAKLPDTTLGRDIAELVRTGVIDSMSFGFSVKKDSWTADGQTRYLEDVTLYETSLVSAPAYEATAGSVSVRNLNPDQLAEALLKLESGEQLEPTDADLINEVVSKLKKTEEVQEVEGDILALKKAKLDLLMKEAQSAI